jgi:hypothetical protein
MCHDFKYFGQIFIKKNQMLGSDTDPDQPDPSRHALDVDPDPDLDPAKLYRSDQIRIRSTSLQYMQLRNKG